jgi:hypothetical protein
MNELVKNEAKEIAQTILNQLGGNKFITMTGSRVSYSLNENAQPVLICKLPRNFAKDGINLVKIIYNYGLDLYVLNFNKEEKILKTIEQVYADDLIEIFESETGLFVHF